MSNTQALFLRKPGYGQAMGALPGSLAHKSLTANHREEFTFKSLSSLPVLHRYNSTSSTKHKIGAPRLEAHCKMVLDGAANGAWL